MSEYTVQEHNATTGEIKMRPMNAEELGALESHKVQAAAEQAAAEQAAIDKAALLAKLGLTADEFKTLLGGN